MSKVRRWVLCRTGTFGQDGSTITEKDIDELVETFPGRRPPVAIGHSMAYDDKMPQFGSILDVFKVKKKQGVELVGDVKLIEAMDKVYEEGAYQGWSVSIPKEAATGKRYLHHLALCGSVPPKIPGLVEVGVSYGDKEEKEIFSYEDSIEYKEDSMTDEEKKKMEALEKENADIKKELEDLKKQAGGKTEPPSGEKSKEFADLEKRHEELMKKFEANEAAGRKGRLESFMKAVADRVPAGVKAKVNALAEQLVAIPAFNYADGDKEVEGCALNMFEDVLMASPAPVKTGSAGFNYSDAGSDGKAPDWSKAASKF